MKVNRGEVVLADLDSNCATASGVVGRTLAHCLARLARCPGTSLQRVSWHFRVDRSPWGG
jgi:hypothetical protein